MIPTVESGKFTVLHASPTWLPITQTWMHGQVQHLQLLGIQTHVACERTDNLDQFNVDNLYSLSNEPLLRRAWDKALRKLKIQKFPEYLVRIGKRVNADIVHSHFGNIGWENLGAVRRINAKHVVTFYGYDVNKLPNENSKWIDRYQSLFKSADIFLCEGSHMVQCINDLGCPITKIHILHIGVDVNNIQFQPRQWQPKQALRILITASFREKKGIPYALQALGLLKNEIAIELTIIGDAGTNPADQREKNLIISLLAEYGLAECTRLLGFQPHDVILNEAYNHHIFMHPSVTAMDGDTEGGAPVSIIEMMATGMPVISTRHCDIPEVMGIELEHLLVNERDAVALRTCLINLVSHPDRWDDIARIGRQRIETEYNIETQTQKLINLYQGLLTG